MRQSSSRNQRNKGFRVKHFLQLGLLAVICFWLLYQLKHSYDKKRAIEEQNAKIFDREADRQLDFFKLGRKDLPRSEETGAANDTYKKEDEKEVVEEEEEQETKQEAENEGGRGVGDDEIDETDDQDQERADEEAEHIEESIEEEDKDAQADGMDFLDDEEREGGSQEAREEHYKRDDASSAVHHDTQMTESEFGNGHTRNLDDEQMGDKVEKNVERENAADMEKKDIERENVANGTFEGSMGEGGSVGRVDGSNGNVSSIVLAMDQTMSNDTISRNEVSDEKREPEVGGVKSEVRSISNPASLEHDSQSELQTNLTTSAESNNQTELQANSTTVPTNQMETKKNSTEVDAVADVPLQNKTVELDSAQDQNATVDTRTPGEDNPSLTDEVLEQPEKSVAQENKEATEGKSNDPSQTEKSDTSENGDEAQGESDASMGENGDSVPEESDISSHDTVTAEEREARTDMSTLPNIDIEAKNDEDAAAE